MSEVYSTNQAAELTGISADTIRTWKRRQTDKLLEKQHWLKDENNTLLWTELGVQVLAQLQSGGELPESSNDEPPTSSNVNDSEVQPEPASSSLLNRYEPLLNLIADAVVPELQQRLDNKIMGKVQNLGKQSEPLTATECVSILTKLGLKPVNPSVLLTGKAVQALPQSNQ